MKKKSIGFLIGVFILAFVLKIGYHFYSKNIDKKVDNAKYIIKVYYKENLEKFKLEFGDYPSSEEGLNSLLNRKNKFGISIVKIRLEFDPWSNPYRYLYPGIHTPNGYDLWSFGADNKPGGKGADADINSWEK